MTKAQNKEIKVEAVRKYKVETTYEYVPILGEILGFWRKTEKMRVGETVELHIKTKLQEYDRLFINGQQIKFAKDNV